MEFGYAVVMPTFVLLDSNLSPLERLLYGVASALADRNGSCTATNEALAKHLRVKTDGVLKQVSADAVQRMLERLQERGCVSITEVEEGRSILVLYQKAEVQVTVKPIPKAVLDNTELATKVLEYFSEARITRGYSKVRMKPTKANLESINARLSDGHSYDDCISVINIKFEDDFFKKNLKYLTPQTVFRPTNFEKYLSEAGGYKDIEKKVITKYGLSMATQTPVSQNLEEVEF